MKKTFRIDGMTCNSCAQHIEKDLSNEDGVRNVSVSFAKEQAEVEFDTEKISEHKIKEIIKETGYDPLDDISESNSNERKPKEANKKKSEAIYWHIAILSIFVLAVLYVFLEKFNLGISFSGFDFSSYEGNASLILLFFAGLLTGFHCIAMCGGFLISYTAKNAAKGHASFYQHLIYGGSKTVSYAVIGALFGLIGSIFVFSPALRGGIAIFAGIFMVFYSLSLFGLKFFRRFQFNPKFLNKIATKKYSGVYFGPMMTGLLNGLFLACGPLQALYLYAAGTGSAITGGLSLMVFGLGTLPVMLGFGGVANILGAKSTKKILKISAIVVLVLGLIMLNRGLSLTGSGYDYSSIVSRAQGVDSVENSAVYIDNDGYQIINMDVTRYGWTPDRFVLKKGVPTKWVIDGKEITGCNNAIQVPKLNLKFDIRKGEQIIEFTPTEEGVIPWSCWMGMISGTFIVTEDGAASDAQVNSAVKTSASTGGSCGGSCGSPTCGAASGGGCGCGG